MRYLVTGGSGFLGQELIKRLAGNEVVVLARNEGKLVELKEKFPWIEIIVGSVTDEITLEKAMHGVDGVFHLAAMKHVGLAEDNVRECIETNIVGTKNLLVASLRHDPEFVLVISTDKAASRKGVYGTTKYLMERLVSEFEKFNPRTKYRIVRYGNVIYSTGSVLCKWKEKIQNAEPIVITDLDATRFFWTVEQAVDLIFECLKKAKDSKPYITQMKSIRMEDLMNAMFKKYLPDTAIPIREVIGLQQGENMHEIIVEGGQTSEEAEKFTMEEIMEMI
jgi:FlaA1/EpsC-like NDP-sugar epimerase